MEAIILYTDDELVSALQRTDAIAFESIYNRYWTRLYPAIYQRVCDKEVTEDILQEIFAYLWVKRESIVIRNLKSYLFATARYQALQYLLRHKAPTAFFEPFESLLLDTETPEEKVIAKELYDWVLRYAETLPSKKRQIFLLHIRDKYSTREIAEQMEISQKTVQNQLASALQDLRTHITPVIIALLSSRL
ncbi:MAG TPA: sigma-70 family RNA polymerase sigma factor [Puia sp.]